MEQPLYWVGVGASAGGLEALRALLTQLQDPSPFTFIIVQHLAPQHRSRLVEILQQSTNLVVEEARDKEVPVAGHIYITPPNTDIVIREGRLQLLAPQVKIGPKPSIDLFLESLAEDKGTQSIGVILSGTGSDGAKGILAIRYAGGVTFGQTIESAKYDGMPRAAKQTGALDYELHPELIAKQLLKLPGRTRGEISQEIQQEVNRDPYKRIFNELERVTKVNFARYKSSTLKRRIERRMNATQIYGVSEYADYLKGHPDEVRLLFQDALISVTSFFRDTLAFKQLSQYILEKVTKKEPEQSFRAWIAGCATGEEAYSICVLILDALEKTKKSLKIQIFATDLDEPGMAIARKGIYPAHQLSQIPAKIKNKYFETSDNDRFKIKSFVRDLIVFARHDVTLDPPFLKLDLISCRNVLIYFTNELQKSVFGTFHYSLNRDGLLFLGKSEATNTAADLFILEEKRSKIYKRSQKPGQLPKSRSKTEMNREFALITRDREHSASFQALLSLITALAPDSVLVDEDQSVIHLFGDANQILNLPQGEASQSIYKLSPENMAIEIGVLVHRVRKTQQSVRGTQRHHVQLSQGQRWLQLGISSFLYEGKTHFLIVFQKVEPKTTAAIVDKTTEMGSATTSLEERVIYLEHQLASAYENLQTVIEEHETAHEELQALNEELQSSNEEMQSTNEEFETTNEELQSANEELTTLNEEINVKNLESQALNQRLQAIQNAISYPLLMVNERLRLTDYNPAARSLLRLSDFERDHPFDQLDSHIDMAEVKKLVRESMRSNKDASVQIKTRNRDFEVRVQLCRGPSLDQEGAVISFVENTEVIQSLEQSKLLEERLSAILNHTPAMVSVKDITGTYMYANQHFSNLLGHDEIVGKTDDELFAEENMKLFREHDFEVLKTRHAHRFEEEVHIHGAKQTWLSSRFPLLTEKKKPYAICCIAIDISERLEHERELEVFRTVLSASSVSMVIFVKEKDVFKLCNISYSFSKQFDVKEPQVKGMDLLSFLERFLRAAYPLEPRPLLEKISSQAHISMNLNIGAHRARENWIELKTSRIELDESGTACLLMMIYDINTQIEAQKAVLIQQEESARFGRLAALGEVAAGISHEINTPLNVIYTKTDILDRLAQLDRLDQVKLRKVTTDIKRMVQSISKVISGLKTVTGLEAVDEVKPHNLVPLIEEAIKICDFKLQQFHIKLSWAPKETKIWIQCFPMQIVQILVNLITNAVESTAELRDRWIKVEAFSTPAFAIVRVLDSGPGIEPALAERIMTPFFTTKRAKKGTGLGLSLSRNIARKHGGNLSVELDAQNTCFRLELPTVLD